MDFSIKIYKTIINLGKNNINSYLDDLSKLYISRNTLLEKLNEKKSFFYPKFLMVRLNRKKKGLDTLIQLKEDEIKRIQLDMRYCEKVIQEYVSNL